METKANYLLIGTFTLAVIVAAFGFIYWFSSLDQRGERATYRVIFDGSVTGLKTGGDVLFNGIRVGEVSDLKLNPENLRQVIATISVNSNVPVRANTQVGLEFTLLTGVAAVSLKGDNLSGAPLPVKAGEIPVLVADPDSTQNITQSARDVLRRLHGLLADNEQSLHNMIGNLDAFSSTLNKNSERLDRILAGLENLTGGSDGKGEVRETLGAVKTLVENLDKRTAEISVGLAKFTGPGLRQWEALALDGRRTLSDLDKAIKNFDRQPSRIIFGGGASAFDQKK